MRAAAILLMHEFFLLLNFTIEHKVKILSHFNNRVLKLTEALNRTHPLQLLSSVPSLDSISSLESHLFKLALCVLTDQLHLFLLRYLRWSVVRCLFDDGWLVIYSFVHHWSSILIFKCI
jgi:hypothetical protein